VVKNHFICENNAFNYKLMRRFIPPLVACLLIFNIGLTQNFPIGNKSISINDPDRNNRQVNFVVYYPAETAGTDAVAAQGSFPLIVFGHGFVMSYTSYMNFRDFYVPKGYVIAFVDMENGFSPSHENFGRDILFGGKQFKNKAQNETSFFLYGKLNGKVAFMGHSMGGGSSMLAASFEPSFPDLVVGLAPAETNPSAIAAAASITAPTIIFSGTNDKVTPPANHHIPIYNAVTSTCKYLINITGGAHCYFAQTDLACDFGETTSGSNPTISRDQQQAITNGLLMPFMEFLINNKPEAASVFNTQLNGAGITFQTNCSLFHVSTETTLSEQKLGIYPNPATDELNFKGLGQGKLYAEILDISGKKVRNAMINSSQSKISLDGLDAGVYFVRINEKVIKFLKK
jgi:pimeloyl-ACP methyl ester carboxylesterase